MVTSARRHLAQRLTGASQTALGSEVADVGFKQAMALKAVKLEKGEVPTVVRLVRGERARPLGIVLAHAVVCSRAPPLFPGGSLHRHRAATAARGGAGAGALLLISSSCALALTLLPQASTISDADLTTLAKKRKLIEQQCVS